MRTTYPTPPAPSPRRKIHLYRALHQITCWRPTSLYLRLPSSPCVPLSWIHSSVYTYTTMLRGFDLLLGCVAWCTLCRAVGGESTQQLFGDDPNQPHVSFQELTAEASKLGMEVIHPAEWTHARRRLEYTGRRWVWGSSPAG